MSCKMNGISMTEGRHSWPMMPATPIADNRHRVDNTPLARAQIEKINGVKYPPPRTLPVRVKPAEGSRYTTEEERAEIVKLYSDGVQIKVIAERFGRWRETIREIVMKAGVHRPVYRSRIRGEHLAKKEVQP